MATIVCFGDSNTWGFEPGTGSRFPRDVRWPGVLRRMLGPDHEVIEEGLNGRTTNWDDPLSEGRNGGTWLGPCLLSHAPVDLVVIMLGTNDLKPTFRLSPQQIAQSAESLVDRARKTLAGPGGTPPRVVLVAPPAVAFSPRSELWGHGASVEASRQFGRLYAEAARWQRCPFLDAGQIIEASPVDGVHIDAAAHESLGLAVAEVVRGELAGIERARAALDRAERAP